MATWPVPRPGLTTPAKTISAIARRYNLRANFHAYDIRGVADAVNVATWPARDGVDAAQASTPLQPAYNAAWPSLRADDVGEAVIAPAVDFSSTGKVCVLAVIDHAAGMNALLRAPVEHGRYFAGTHGWSIFYLPPNERIYFGIGTNGAYQDAAWDFQSGRHVFCFTADSSLTAPNQIRGWIDGVEVMPTATGVGTGMAGNFSSAGLYIGARDDGAGGLERPANSDIQQVVAMGDIPTPAEIVILSRAAMEIAGIPLP